MSTEMTTQEVAAFLGVQDSFVRRLRLGGRLTGKRQVGRTWVFARAAVERFHRTWDRTPGTYDRKRFRK